MTAEEFRKIRHGLNLSAKGTARLLRLSENGDRTIRRWEAGDVPISGPTSLVMEWLGTGERPDLKPFERKRPGGNSRQSEDRHGII